MTNYILVLQIGTFCDHYLMNYVVSEIRKIYKLVFISNKKVCIDPNDINISTNAGGGGSAPSDLPGPLQGAKSIINDNSINQYQQ